jgi:endonuclease YncB( thermonuclease family)
MMTATSMDAAEIVIVDGDTVRMDGETIRLRGFDVPETCYARCDAERDLGEKAKARLAELVRSGKVGDHPEPPRVRSKRVLAQPGAAPARNQNFRSVILNDLPAVASTTMSAGRTESMARQYQGHFHPTR